MALDLRSKRAAFRSLHDEGCFVLPNPWDIGGVRRLEKLGFVALASTSAGLAWALGREDGEVSRDDVLSHLRVLCASTDLPVNADFEAGFAGWPEEVAANVRLAVDTGVAGLSVEDRTGRELYPLPLAVERIKASREAIDQAGADVVLVGRSEGFLVGRADIDATVERLAAYADAGADCLYAPGIRGPRPHRGGRRRGRAEAGQRPSGRSRHAGRGSLRSRRPARERRSFPCQGRLG
ncbi:MAG TPA: isocitrate lyase/phosphoenolpyruvate mutase family protein, partial [Geminicoccaceae bacterium]|nr:isocitrate lyase/phosphoenolpyruvate mutase family protein [Geminicoccaceae bacterium]